MAFWNFPAVVGGNINSINNAGLETFRDNPIESLAREICQNALDAVKDPSQPVTVVFTNFTSTKFPLKQNMVDVFKKCEQTWKGRNPKSEEFIKGAQSILGNSHIEYLRISDFNTKGLKGAKEAELGSPWSSLVKEAGSSNKGDDSGGSFGIGKAAPYLSSGLRTLFYSSQDEDGYKSHIGVSNIMSFKESDGRVTVGTGYYTETEQSTAIEGLLNMDETFKREESGTDIIVSAFIKRDDWEETLIESVIRNFFVTIYHDKLVVKVNDLEVNKHNIGEMINKLGDTDKNQTLKNYFNLLSSKESLRIPYPAKRYKYGISFSEGEAELLLMNGDNLNRKVLMTRKNGMSLFEQGNISGSISFTGLLLITGKNMNKVFKEMENPAHNGWQHERFEKDPNLAKKIYSQLRSFIRESVKTTFQQKTADTMDAIGLSDFLPNKTIAKEEGGEKVETIQPRLVQLNQKKKKNIQTKTPQSSKKGKEKTVEQIMGESGISPGDENGNGFGEGGKGKGTGAGLGESSGTSKLNSDTSGSIGKKEKQKGSVPVPSKQKYVCINKDLGLYRVAVKPDKAIKKGFIKFRGIGEQSNYNMPIRHAEFTDTDVILSKLNSDTIHFVSESMSNNLNLNLEIDFADYCVLEVEVFEDQ